MWLMELNLLTNEALMIWTSSSLMRTMARHLYDLFCSESVLLACVLVWARVSVSLL